MSFRFRRSFKLFPGVKMNLSKGGISTSVGVKGYHVNIGKGGVRQTVSLPGTGISYSTSNHARSHLINTYQTTSAQPNPSPDLQSTQPVKKVGGGEPPKGMNNLKIPKGCLLAVGIISVLCLIGSIFGAVIGAINPTPAPTNSAIYTSAMLTVIAPYTQTANALPIVINTSSPLPTWTPLPTLAPLDISTLSLISSSTPLPLATSTIKPITINSQIPSVDPLQNVTAVCKDGTYSYSAHVQGTCSRHGGVKNWIHKPPS